MAGVSSLEIDISTNAGHRRTFHFPPGRWENLTLESFPFPVNDSDRLQVRARVWDLKAGLPRAFPALTGKVSVTADEVATTGPTQVHLRLTLQVPVSDYDDRGATLSK